MTPFEVVQAFAGLLFIFVFGTFLIIICGVAVAGAFHFWKFLIEEWIIDPIKKWNRYRKIKKGYAALAANPEYQEEVRWRMARRRRPASEREVYVYWQNRGDNE